jgi:hypothetical protein
VSSATIYTIIKGITSNSYTLTGLSAGTTYNFKIKALCDSTNSTYSSVKSFTTLQGCSDNFEPNNGLFSAPSVPLNTDVYALISTATDKDFYSFNNSTISKNIKVSLTNLPADYDVRLIDPNGTRIAVSQNAGTTSETISFNTNVIGNYKVLVYGYAGLFNSNKCYRLRIVTTSTALREEASRLNALKHIVIYPQPSTSFTNIQFADDWKGIATLTVVSQLGETVLKKQIPANTKTYKLDVSGLANGVYILRINTATEIIANKLLIQH